MQQRRPALVVSDGGLGEGGKLLWVVMITSADNRPWPGDIVIHDPASVGLPAPSVIRPVKIATIEAPHAEVLGRIGTELIASLEQVLARQLGLPQ